MLTDMECRKAVCPEGKKHIRLADAASLYMQVDANGLFVEADLGCSGTTPREFVGARWAAGGHSSGA